MSAANARGASQRNKSQESAADLIRRGYPHGRRMTRPYPNSGGLTMTREAGSAAYRRLIESKARKAGGR